MMADVGREDPFLPPQEQEVFADQSSGLQLMGITYGGSRPMAIINDTMVYEGDLIEDKKVVKINETSVVIEDEGVQYILELYELSLRGDSN